MVKREGERQGVFRFQSSATRWWAVSCISVQSDLFGIEIQGIWANILLVGPNDRSIRNARLLEITDILQLLEYSEVEVGLQS
jgi:hypothetical protein